MWTPPAPPANESERLAELRRYAILDTLPEQRFDRIARLAQRFYGVSAAHLSFMDADQQWLKAKTDRRLPDSLPRDQSLCTMVVASAQELVIDDLAADETLKHHPATKAGVWRFYAGVPLRGAEGHVIGTLCILKDTPGAPPDFTTEVLNDLADIATHELGIAQVHAELSRQTNTDALTGLANRRMFDSEIERAIRRHQRTGAPMSLLLIDLDHFKAINDTWGHGAGDEALKSFADVFKSFARRGDDISARIGGEEFALILSGANREGAEHVAAELAKALAEAGIGHPTQPYLTASIGVAMLGAGEPADRWIARVDRALYAAKAAGRATSRSG